MIKNIILALLIAIIYNFFVYKLVNVMVSESESAQDVALIIIFIIGIITLVLAQTLFQNHPTFKNRPIKYGLTLGSLILIGYTLFVNWNTMTDQTRLIIIGIVFTIIIWICYYYFKDSDKINKIKNIYKHKNVYN